jgi:hypothetical protein
MNAYRLCREIERVTIGLPVHTGYQQLALVSFSPFGEITRLELAELLTTFLKNSRKRKL